MFSHKHFYSRSQINAVVGGSLRAYLPMVEGHIVAACLSLILHPRAPQVIFVGRNEEEAGEVLASQKDAVPVFVKTSPGKWMFHGYYRAHQSSKLPSVIEKHTRDCRARGVIRVVLMERCDDGPPVIVQHTAGGSSGAVTWDAPKKRSQERPRRLPKQGR